MAQPYPLPRSTRETEIKNGDGGATYGPFDFKIFDKVDVRAFVRRAGDEEFEPIAFTVTKVAGQPFDDFTATFEEPLTAADDFIVQSARLHERMVAITRGGTVSAIELEKELSKQGSVIEELRRDIDRGGSAVPGRRGQTLVFDENGSVRPGADQSDIEQAHINAEQASAAAAAAIAAANSVDYRNVPTRAVLKSLPDTLVRTAVVFAEGHRNGTFAFVPGDQSANVAADTLEGVYVAPDSDPSGASGAWLRQSDLVLRLVWFLPSSPTPLETSAAIQAMFDLGHVMGIKEYDFTGLDLTMGSDSIGTDEGTAVIYRSEFDGFRLIGHGCTIRPASNRIELFAQFGSNARLEGFTFDNSANGPLNNTYRPSPMVPMGGVAGRGNFANCVWRQYGGEGGLVVRDVSTIDMHTDFQYAGSGDNDHVVGHVSISGYRKHGGMFGLLISKPETLDFSNNEGHAIVNSRNAEGSATLTDPGHLLYLTDRSGAAPRTVTVSDCRGTDGESTLIKIRNGQSVAVNNIVVDGCVSGIELENIRNLTASNLSIRTSGEHTSPAGGLWIIGLGQCEVSDVFIDIRGQSETWGIRGTQDGGSSPWNYARGRLSDITVLTDNTAPGYASIIMQGFKDFDLINFREIVEGTQSITRRPIDLRSCENVRVIDPSKTSGPAQPQAAWLVALDSGCIDCVVAYHPAEALPVAPTGATISDAGTNTTIIQGRTIKDGRSTLTLDASGNVDITFTTPFRYTCTALVANIQSGVISTAEVIYTRSSPTATGAQLGVRPNPGAVSRGIHYIATGY